MPRVTFQEELDTNATPNHVRGTSSIRESNPKDEPDAYATSKPKFMAREQATPKFFVALPTELQDLRPGWTRTSDLRIKYEEIDIYATDRVNYIHTKIRLQHRSSAVPWLDPRACLPQCAIMRRYSAHTMQATHAIQRHCRPHRALRCDGRQVVKAVDCDSAIVGSIPTRHPQAPLLRSRLSSSGY